MSLPLYPKYKDSGVEWMGRSTVALADQSWASNHVQPVVQLKEVVLRSDSEVRDYLIGNEMEL